jgi:hypothetical protein
MKQLTMRAIFEVVQMMKEQGMTTREIMELPIYLGRDDELNGIHTGWYVNLVDPNNEDDAYLVEMINEDRCNIEIKGKAILIS